MGMGLEGALAFIAADGPREVTPQNPRLRDADLTASSGEGRGASAPSTSVGGAPPPTSIAIPHRRRTSLIRSA